MSKVSSLRTLIKSFTNKEREGMWVALPATVLFYDPVKCTCSASISVLSDEGYPYPVLYDVPVVMQGGGGFSMSFQLASGDPVLLVFCHRGIKNAMTAIFSRMTAPQKPSGGIMGIGSPVAIPVIGTGGYSMQSGIGIHNTTGVSRVELQENKVVVVAKGKGFTVLDDGSVEFTNGARITADGDFVSATGVALSTHLHSSVTSGSEESGPPVPIP